MNYYLRITLACKKVTQVVYNSYVNGYVIRLYGVIVSLGCRNKEPFLIRVYTFGYCHIFQNIKFCYVLGFTRTYFWKLLMVYPVYSGS